MFPGGQVEPINAGIRDLLPDGRIIFPIIREDIQELHVNGCIISIVDAVSDDERKALLPGLVSIPAPLLSYIFENKGISILAHEDFMVMRREFLGHAPPSLGANFTGDLFVIDRDLLLDPVRARRVRIAIWYAVGALLAEGLNDIEGFSAPIFQAQFTRYMRSNNSPQPSPPVGEGRVRGIVNISAEYRVFFDELFAVEVINKNKLRSLYAEKMGVELPNTGIFSDTYLPMTPGISSASGSNLFSQIHERGFTLGRGNLGLSIGMVNKQEMTRPESEHEVRAQVYSRRFNNLVSSLLTIGGWTPAPLISAGMMVSYQSPRPEAAKQWRIFGGAGFDLGLDPETGLILHSYIGIPLFLSGGGIGEESFQPYWEAGVVRIGSNGPLFVGASVSTSLSDLSQYYLGFVSRWGY